MKRPDNKRPLLYVLFKKYGVKGALRILYKDVGFDVRHGVNTAAPVSQKQLFGAGFTSEQHRYVASTFDVMYATLKFAAGRHDLSRCGFVDLGSGKGKALIAASEFAFNSLQGVELSSGMNAIARKNFQKLELDERVGIFAGSATEYVFKPHERIIYFFNSFSGDTLEVVLQNLANATRTAPGMFIYVNPTERLQVEKYFPCIDHQFIDPGCCEVSYHELPATI